MFDKYDRNNVKFYHENNVLSSTSQGLLSQFIDILACVFDIFNECNYRYNTTFPLFNKMLKQFVFIKQHCIYPFRTIFNPERAVTEDAVGRFNRKHLVCSPNAYSSIKNKYRPRGLWCPLRGHGVFSERLLLNYR